MSKRLFVGNLAFSTTEHELREAFGPFGSLLDVAVVTDRMSGQSRGFGFVEMENDGEAQEAIGQLDGSLLGGRNIKVNEARERSDAARGGFRGGDSRGASNRGSSQGGGYDRW